MAYFSDYLNIAILGFSLSLMFGLAFVIFFGFLGLRDYSLKQKRSAHFKPTARFGGFAALASLLITWLILELQFDYEILLILFPIFCLGLLEDTGMATNPKLRLASGALSSIIFIFFKGIWILECNVPGLDYLLQYTLIAVAFTIFCLVGLTNAFNLIDGVNGLACGAIIIVASATFFFTAAGSFSCNFSSSSLVGTKGTKSSSVNGWSVRGQTLSFKSLMHFTDITVPVFQIITARALAVSSSSCVTGHTKRLRRI